MRDEQLRSLAEAGRDEMVEFARRLIQTPSLPGYEGAVAGLVEEEMRRLGYDQVWRDRAGNVVGLIKATAGVASVANGATAPPAPRSIMFNAHMDHVDVGDVSNWPYPPYDATVADGAIWGRGASDLKGPLACQIHAIAALKRLERPLPNDCYVSAVVQEEVGGLGAIELVKTVHTDYCVLGEPTTNTLMRGHRGRVELRITFTGRSVHASVPQQGLNPLYSLGRFLQLLELQPMQSDPNQPGLGPSSVAPTLLYTDQTSSNVTPSEVTLHLDWRNVPSESVEQIVAKVQSMVQKSVADGCVAKVEPLPRLLTSYTGVEKAIGAVSPPFGVAEDHPLVVNGKRVLEAALGRNVPVGLWRFATDGGHFVNSGTPCIGFSPAWAEVIHTVEERISIELMVEAYAGYMALGLGL